MVDNLSSGKRANLNPQVSAFYELDILDADGLQQVFAAHRPHAVSHQAALANDCLLYTSDAADERPSVDLGGRRIIKIHRSAPSPLRHHVPYQP